MPCPGHMALAVSAAVPCFAHFVLHDASKTLSETAGTSNSYQRRLKSWRNGQSRSQSQVATAYAQAFSYGGVAFQLVVPGPPKDFQRGRFDCAFAPVPSTGTPSRIPPAFRTTAPTYSSELSAGLAAARAQVGQLAGWAHSAARLERELGLSVGTFRSAAVAESRRLHRRHERITREVLERAMRVSINMNIEHVHGPNGMERRREAWTMWVLQQ